MNIRFYIFVLFSIFSMQLPAQVVYVTPTGAGNNSGTSWANAKSGSALRDVIATLPDSGSVWIAAGTYTPHPTDRTVAFSLLQNRKIYGGFAGTEISINDRNWVANPTILSGDIGIAGNASDNSYTVLEVGSDNIFNTDSTKFAIIDGVTIAKGNNPGTGAGVVIKNGYNRPRFYNCTIKENNAFVGAAVYDIIEFVNKPYFFNCTFSQNTGSSAVVYGRSTTGNYGGATFEQCKFINNTSTGTGFAGCFGWNTWSTTNDVYLFKKCDFKNNVVSNGGFFHANNAGSIVMEDCSISKNTTSKPLLYLYNTDFSIANSTVDSNTIIGTEVWSMLYFFTAAKGVTTLFGTTYSQQKTKTNFINSKFVQNYTAGRFMDVSTGTGSMSLSITNIDTTNITNCLFYNCGRNSTFYSDARQGGISNVFINNSTFYNDSVFIEFKAWDRQISQYVTKGTQPTVPTPGVGRMYINNCIIYQPEFWPGTRSIRSEYSLFNSLMGEKIIEIKNTAFHAGGGIWPSLGGTDMGGNLINVNPMFIDELGGNFRLHCNSPLINAGASNLYSATFPNVDLDSNSRISGGVIDMGAYEYDYTPLQIQANVSTNSLQLDAQISANFPIDSIRWTLGDGNFGDTNPITYTYANNGTYNVCAKVYTNCVTKDTCFSVNLVDTSTSIRNTNLDLSTHIFPNPAQTFINVEGLAIGITITIYDILGKAILSQEISQEKATINISSLSKGLYLLQAQTKEGKKGSVKLIKS